MYNCGDPENGWVARQAITPTSQPIISLHVRPLRVRAGDWWSRREGSVGAELFFASLLFVSSSCVLCVSRNHTRLFYKLPINLQAEELYTDSIAHCCEILLE